MIPLGSAQTGLMVWRDYDVVVDAPGLGGGAAFETMRPLLGRSRAARCEADAELRRHYFVLRLPSAAGREWKLDVSFFVAGLPPGVETAPRDLCRRLSPENRLAILRFKDAWHRHPAYPEVVGAVHIYDAVLEHGIDTLAALDEYLAERGLPTLYRGRRVHGYRARDRPRGGGRGAP